MTARHAEPKAAELDDALIVLCNEACDSHAGTVRIEDEHEAQGLPIPYETLIWPKVAHWHELCAEIANTPAHTAEGIKAKARVIADIVDIEDDPMVASIIADILRRPA